jgi:capsid portal protein
MDDQIKELRLCVKEVDSLSLEFMICKFVVKADVSPEKLRQMQRRLMDAQGLCDRLLEEMV